jgi:uncharacterized protein YeaO (DUF488 family)
MAVAHRPMGEAGNRMRACRIGTVRRPPAGVRKAEFARRDYYDVWLPELAPSEPLRAWALSQAVHPTALCGVREKIPPRDERARGPAAHRPPRRPFRSTNFSVGCYCEDESHCHRSLLGALLREAEGAMEP